MAADPYKKQIEDTLSRILAELPADASEDSRRFIRHFFRKMPIADLQRMVPGRAARIALNALEWAQSRSADEPKIRIYEPRRDEHGWQAGITVVEIINDDMPFLVDSVTGALDRRGLTPEKVIHPIVPVKRGAGGALKAIGGGTGEEGMQSESIMHIQVPLLPEDITPAELESELRLVLRAVKLSVIDWRDMVEQSKKAETALKEGEKHAASPLLAEEMREVRAFLQWLRDKNFIFLGYVEYDFTGADAEQAVLEVVPGSEMGLFKLDDLELKPQGLQGLPPEVLHFALLPHIIEITKSNRRSVVHRSVPMDYIGIKRMDKDGKVIGERRFLGLFTSIVYYQSAGEIPLIRSKIDHVLARANFDPLSHDGKAMRAILEFSPRDELFQMNEDELFDYAMTILSLEARPRVGLFLRTDLFERFVSAMVFIPRDRFNTGLREKISEIIEDAYKGSITAFYTQMTDSPLARVQLIVKTTPGQLPKVGSDALEQRIAQVTNSWTDALAEALEEAHGARHAASLIRRYRGAFSASYVGGHTGKQTLHDIDKIEEALSNNRLALDLFRSGQNDTASLQLKIYNPGQQASLSDILPMLENMGVKVLDEHPYRVTPSGVDYPVWIRNFRMTPHGELSEADVTALKHKFEETLAHVWAGDVENDGFNALVMRAGLSWRQVVLLRAYAHYARQTEFAYSTHGIVEALTRYPEIARLLVEYFHTRFDPQLEGERSKQEKAVRELLDRQQAGVENLAHDRILKRFAGLIEATLRTNFFQPAEDGEVKPYISFKLDSTKAPGLPLPRPFREIYVYSTRVEGIHLRGGKVARGGLRWSDRPEDFRTEVLGLMKAQMVKNAVIVPVGSKGGFVLKKPPTEGGREALLQEGVESYKTFLRGLLDLTDNIVQGAVVPPANVVRHDEDDPYLVVAADKGTASFSDYANSVSAEYDFWLGDAFASGGSVGYDHKAMGITAKGAWISVQRHFQEMGHDTQGEDFSAIGIGDMAGDVFGNGMLLSEHIRLVGAFNHMHIFLDPDPDAARSFKERERLFNLPRSSWEDYDASLISKGGGVFKRSEKSIKVSAQAAAALGIEPGEMAPDELIRAMLRAPVDLLWNGGIGTYVKASTESNEEVGDRANDALRVNGIELRCKVVGEGGNLGFTQRGRVEYALNGGRLNTDAIDNSAGVDCSDHEVNIKIAFRNAMEAGQVTLEQRNAILVDMTGEVARLVLRDNELQTQALTNAEHQGTQLLESQARMMRSFERAGLLNRAVEFLPDDKKLLERMTGSHGLTRPELAVLLSYSKMALYAEILSSNLPDDPYFHQDLLRYFPKRMQDEFDAAISDHRLRREIIATVTTNSIINRAGITFFHQLKEDTGMLGCDIARAYTIARDAFDLRAYWNAVEAAGPELTPLAQSTLFTRASRSLAAVTQWLLRHGPQPLEIAPTMEAYASGIAEYMALEDSLIIPRIREAYEERMAQLAEAEVPEEMAKLAARFDVAAGSLDVVKVARESNRSIPEVAEVYFELRDYLQLGWLRQMAARLPRTQYWERLAVEAIIRDFYDQQQRLTVSVVPELCDGRECGQAVARWAELNGKAVERYLRFIEDLKANPVITLSMLTIAQRNLGAVG